MINTGGVAADTGTLSQVTPVVLILSTVVMSVLAMGWTHKDAPFSDIMFLSLTVA